jgi:exopolysaccharide biosynthesis polyprenyl glycosylphosphotransferase
MKTEQALFLEKLDASRSGVAFEWSGVSLDGEHASVARTVRGRLNARRYMRLLAVVADFLALTLAFVSAGVLRFGDPLHPLALQMLSAIFPVYVIAAANNRCFHLNAVLHGRTGAWNATVAFLVSLSVVGLAVFFLKAGPDFSRAVFGTGAIFALILIPVFRVSFANVGRRLFGETMESEIIIEDGVNLDNSTTAIRLDCRRLGLEPRLDDPIMLDRLGRYLQGADRVVVACPPERRAVWAIALKGADINAEVVAAELDQLGPIGLSTFEGRSTLVVAASPLGVIDRTLKRVLDLVLVVIALPVALPIMAAVAAAVRIDSAGPVLFRQKRVGLGNRMFTMYKFRSMYTDRTDLLGGQSASRDDDRVTRVGRFIRATSLDELPQLLNVLSGAMSVVGPRPHPLQCKAEDRLFWDIDLTYWHRHAVKPGLTGLAQVRGFRGATEKMTDLTDRLQADLEYLSGWTIWRDIGIILATFRVLVHRNAF